MTRLMILRRPAAPSGFANGYGYYRTWTIANSQVPGSTDFTDAPALFDFTDNSLKSVANSGKVENGTHLDVRFETPAGTKLDHVIVSYAPTTGRLIAWVRVPTLAATADTVVRVYYGKAGLGSSEQNAAGLARSSFKAMWPLDDGSTLSGADRSSSGRTLTNSGATAATSNTKVNGGAAFNGSSQSMSGARSGLPALTGAWSISGWINCDAQGGGVGRFLSWYDGSRSIQLGRLANGLFLATGTGSGDVQPQQSQGSTSGLVYFTFTHDGAGTYKTFINGADVSGQSYGGSDITLFTGNSTTVYLGFRGNTSYCACTLDELWVEDVAITVNEHGYRYNNMNAPGTFAALGSEVTP